MFDEEMDFNEDETTEDPEAFEPDPSVIAALDQQGAQFMQAQEEFEAMYGFKHDCVCSQDYAEGNLETVTKCFTNLVDEALETCARLNWENALLKGMLETVLRTNGALVDASEGEVAEEYDSELKDTLFDELLDGEDEPEELDL